MGRSTKCPHCGTVVTVPLLQRFTSEDVSGDDEEIGQDSSQPDEPTGESPERIDFIPQPEQRTVPDLGVQSAPTNRSGPDLSDLVRRSSDNIIFRWLESLTEGRNRGPTVEQSLKELGSHISVALWAILVWFCVDAAMFTFQLFSQRSGWIEWVAFFWDAPTVLANVLGLWCIRWYVGAAHAIPVHLATPVIIHLQFLFERVVTLLATILAGLLLVGASIVVFGGTDSFGERVVAFLGSVMVSATIYALVYFARRHAFVYRRYEECNISFESGRSLSWDVIGFCLLMAKVLFYRAPILLSVSAVALCVVSVAGHLSSLGLELFAVFGGRVGWSSFNALALSMYLKFWVAVLPWSVLAMVFADIVLVDVLAAVLNLGNLRFNLGDLRVAHKDKD